MFDIIEPQVVPEAVYGFARLLQRDPGAFKVDFL
jgi:hypothetical protein